MTALIKYEAACHALAECRSIDEVKTWSDKAAAMQAYGRMAKDKTLEIDAAEIRIRAERRLGELISAQKLGVGLNRGTVLKGTTDGKSSVVVTDDRREKPTLADAGVSKDLSSRAQKLAAVPEAQFEAEVGEWRDRVKAEGARVSSRLQQAGEKAMKEKPEPAPADDGPTDEEINQSQRAQQEEIDALMKLAAADDKLAAAMEEAKQLRAMNRVLTERNNGLMNEKSELVRRIKALQRKIEKLEQPA